MKITLQLTERALATLLGIAPSYVHKLVSAGNCEQLSEQFGKQARGVKCLKISTDSDRLVSKQVSKPVSKTKISEQVSEQNRSPIQLRISGLDTDLVSKPVSKPDSDKNKEANKNNNINNNNILENMAKSIEDRKEDFYKSLIPYVEKYGRRMVRDFFDYWSEYNRSGKKMRCELQPTWEVSKRLATWHRKNKDSMFDSGKLEIGQALNDSQTDDIVKKANF